MRHFDLPGRHQDRDRAGEPPEAAEAARVLAGLAADWTDQAAEQAGSAREPGELLGELRRRLDRLPASHPSAGRERLAGREVPAAWQCQDAGTMRTDEQPAGREPQDSAATGLRASAGAERPFGRDRQAGRAVPEGPGRVVAERAWPGDGEPAWRGAAEPAWRGAAEPAWLAGRAADAGSADGAWLADAWFAGAWLDGAGETGGRQAYRPWFLAGDAAAPWFAAQPYPDGWSGPSDG